MYFLMMNTFSRIVVFIEPVLFLEIKILHLIYISANGLKHAFVLVQISRYQQVIGLYTLQAQNEAAKVSDTQ